MWRFGAPAFERDFKTILFDHVGAGGSDLKHMILSSTGVSPDTLTI
jgi:hypothetical protein